MKKYHIPAGVLGYSAAIFTDSTQLVTTCAGKDPDATVLDKLRETLTTGDYDGPASIYFSEFSKMD